MTINQQQDAIIDEFVDMDDWMDRYQLLIDMGNELEALDEKYKTNQNLIDGCQSRVWVQCDSRDGRLYFQADSDALIVKGIIALLIQVLSGHTPAEILDTDLYFIDRIGLRDHLSPTRSNGLLAMIKQIKAYALAYKTKGGGMMRTISIVLLWLCCTLGWAQTADERAGEYINQRQWFALQDLCATDSAQMSPFIRLFAQSMTAQMFNQPAEANKHILALIRQHQEQMGFANVYNMMLLLIDNYSRMGDNAAAADAARRFATQIDSKVPADNVASVWAKERLYTALQAYDLYSTDTLDHTVPLTYTQIADSAQGLITLSGSVNKRQADFIFDTGTSYNVISPELARRYGLRLMADSIKAQGTRSGGGQMAIADDLTLGNVHLRNVPFAVLDIGAGNERIRHTVGRISLIIGQPLLRQYGRYTIDLTNRTLYLYRHSARRPVRSNAYLDGALYAEIAQDGHRMPIVLDTGANKTTLGKAYYKDFSALVAREGKWTIEGASGFGGIVYNSVFRLPQIAMQVSGRPFTLRNVSVVALSTGNGLAEGYGRLGMDFVRLWQQVTVDNTNMTIEVK